MEYDLVRPRRSSSPESCDPRFPSASRDYGFELVPGQTFERDLPQIGRLPKEGLFVRVVRGAGP